MVARIIYTIACLFMGWVTFSIYTNTISAKLKYQYDPGLRTMREDGIFLAYIGLVIFIIISHVFFKKIMRTIQWKSIATILFLITLEEAIFNIAFGMRAEFGATWTNMDVRRELVFAYWQSWVLLAGLLLSFILLLWCLTKMDRKNVDLQQKTGQKEVS